MKVSIDENGQMAIAPETALEAYALKHWVEDNISEGGKWKDGANLLIYSSCESVPAENS